MDEHRRLGGGIRVGLANPTVLVAAWLNGNPTTPVIHDSHNVTSLTNNATGTYTVTWAVPFSPDGGYPMAGCCRIDADAVGGTVGLVSSSTATSAQFATSDSNGGALVNAELLHVIAWEKR